MTLTYRTPKTRFTNEYTGEAIFIDHDGTWRMERAKSSPQITMVEVLVAVHDAERPDVNAAWESRLSHIADMARVAVLEGDARQFDKYVERLRNMLDDQRDRIDTAREQA